MAFCDSHGGSPRSFHQTMAPRYEDAVDGPQSWVSGRPGQTFLITSHEKKITCLTLIPTTCAHACEYAHVTEYICIYIHIKFCFMHLFIYSIYCSICLFLCVQSWGFPESMFASVLHVPQFQDMGLSENWVYSQ